MFKSFQNACLVEDVLQFLHRRLPLVDNFQGNLPLRLFMRAFSNACLATLANDVVNIIGGPHICWVELIPWIVLSNYHLI